MGMTLYIYNIYHEMECIEIESFESAPEDIP